MSQTLERALAAQDQRRDWILEHWPHIVEHAEITRTLAAHTAGPELGLLLDQLALLDITEHDPTSPDALLADAARTNQPWLRVALSRLVAPNVDHASPPTIDLLRNVAAYRDRWGANHPTPLGIAAHTDEQARELDDLAQQLRTVLGAQLDGPSLPGDQNRPSGEQSVAELNL